MSYLTEDKEFSLYEKFSAKLNNRDELKGLIKNVGIRT